MGELEDKFELLGKQLSSLGWSPDQAIVVVLDGDKEDGKGFLGKAFFLEIYGYLRNALCLKEGGVKPDVERGATLLSICTEAIETITDTNVNASLIVDIIVSIGLDRFCMK